MQESAFEPTVLGALWRYRRIAALIVLGTLLVGLIYARNQSSDYEAVATLVVEDPRASSVFETEGLARPERYVNNQASILASEIVAERAAEIARGEGVELTPGEISRSLTINVFEESDEIGVAVVGPDEETAVVAANAVALAYEETRRQGVLRSYEQALDQLDASIAALGERLDTNTAEIEEISNSNPARAVLEQQYQEALSHLAELQASLASAPAEARGAIRDELNDVQTQLQTLEQVLALDQSSPAVARLLQEQTQIIQRSEELQARRDEVEVDASLESTGIVLFSPATSGTSAGSSTIQAILASLILGLLIAVAVTYRLAVVNRRFTDRSQPETVVDSALLTEVPDFGEERVGTLPVVTHPASAAAESFRFVIPAINRASSIGAGRDQDFDPPKSFVIVSAASGDGKSVVTANLAFAAALQQTRVLVVDADFGDQQLTNLLTGSARSELGLSDLTDGHVVRDIVRPVQADGFPKFDLISRGGAPITAPEFFGSWRANAFFREIRAEYDIVLVDAPPLLQVAYTSSLVQLTDRAVVIVPHGSSVGRLEELAHRLQLMDAPSLGYVYTKAPLRLDLPRNEGSMRDILGVGRQR
jgi:Mrp family chromosome partitioning ATPase/uncharacterized protein involved in exopolysaccharide biosynthesis